MNIVVDSALLAEALEDASKAISAKAIIPIMSCFFIEATEDRLIVTGTDDRATIQSFIEENIQVKEQGSVVLPKVLLEIIKKINGEIRIEVRDGCQAVIRSRNKEIEMSGIDPDEYPSPPEINQNEFIQIVGKDLKELIKKVVFAADIDGKSMPIITGVNVSLKNQKIEMVATNRHRLSQIEKEIEASEIGSAVIEARGLIELQKIILDKDEVEFGFSKSNNGAVIYAFARTERFVFYSRVLEGIYPDTERMTKIFNEVTRITVSKKELIESIELIYTLAKEEKNNAIQFTATKRELNIRGRGKETGKANESIEPTGFEGEEFKISLNARYALDALKSLNSEHVTLIFTGKSQPIFITGIDDANSVFIVLPYRTEG
ncbi:DNA polymerase III subunit beta [Paenibacillus sp. P2(2022)]|uniref:DNA polymerase III subunit beta n=1 Tax=Paenibacillus sp. P2(2022) TaxID=2917813 RepID=UPI002404B421|nr:DNA polymerase III subunit beta [Paenibacillus sp. P2(2022)]MDG0053032.1 DNA polymerase III subunit beta [Paenibacillus sp. P2(2022)]